MNKILKKISYALGMGCALFALASCSDPDDELTSVEFDRLFAPTNLEFRVNQVDVTVNWGCLSEADTVSYVAELYNDGGALTFQGNPAATYTSSTRSVLMEDLAGATTYSFRVKAVGQVKESNWATGTFQTATEQILEAVATEDVGGTYVTLRWPAGEVAATIEFVPTTDTSAKTVNYTVTADDIANGFAYIEGLSPETDYTATMYRADGEIRGQRTFTTTIDTGNMTVLREGTTADDLLAAIEADDGRGIFLMDALDIAMGDVDIDKNVTIAGNPAAVSTLRVKFGVATSVGSLTLSNLKLDGSAVEGQEQCGNFIEITDAAGTLSTISLNSCEITGYGKNFIYNNKKGNLGDIVINNCYIHDLCPTGGDGFDFRGGTIASLTVTNTTFANGFRTFVRCQAELTGGITFDHCTFYNLCNEDTGSNNSGLFRITDGESATFTVTNSIFYAIGNDQCSGNAGVWARTDGMKVSRESYSDNYWFNSPNLWGKLHADDNASVATEADPQFVDAANGNLTPQDEDMVYYGAGDPRWLK